MDKIFSRNKFFIDTALQSLLLKTKIAFLGCGLSSQVAVLSARTGIGNFLFADGDTVDYSNLNRQAYNNSHVGLNKAVVMEDLVKKINNKIKVEVYNRNIILDDIDYICGAYDIIVCTIDVSSLYFEIAKRVQIHKKVAIFPLNIGYSSFNFVVNINSGNFDDLFNNDLPTNDLDYYKRLFFMYKDYLPHYLVDMGDNFLNNFKEDDYFPQLGIACYLNSSIINTIIISILLNNSIPVLPEPIMFDILEIINRKK